MGVYSDGDPPASLESSMFSTAVALAGLDPSTCFYEFHDCAGDIAGYGSATYWNVSGSLSGTGSIIAGAEAGGSIILSSGATASSRSKLQPFNEFAGTPDTKGFYFAMRAAVTTAIDNVAICAGGTQSTSTSNSLQIGVVGAISTANFVLQHSSLVTSAPTGVSLGVAIDTSYHTFEMWGRGDNIVKARIDGGAITEATLSVAYGAQHMNIQARNQGTAADRRIKVDWFVRAGAR